MKDIQKPSISRSSVSLTSKQKDTLIYIKNEIDYTRGILLRDPIYTTYRGEKKVSFLATRTLKALKDKGLIYFVYPSLIEGLEAMPMLTEAGEEILFDHVSRWEPCYI